MVKIILFCGAGISSSILATRMREAARKMHIELSVEAYPENGFEKYLNDADAVLLGPQVRYLHDKLKKICMEKRIPVDIISNTDYGMMKAENILNLVLRLIDNNKENHI
ncbi:PTS sugar transporter subunit IIB [Clostridium chromiireducens]|uniref:PTS sugar transporter subunit IIB n=1 Tax=Clostridium chromiireducens TaxID=225345 RepID=A0A964RKI8_9CLOT|nr:PTS sugar transporter subunit IIB [Clostridium chromiireducens]MVX63241.1 PTS sugar transporter subunit IIB [Clostridium chromiireducens]